MISPRLSPRLSPTLSSLSPPPQRPNRSRLRTVSTIDQFPNNLHPPTLPLGTNIHSDDPIQTSSKLSKSPPEKSRYRHQLSETVESGLFEDLSDDTSVIINKFALPPTNYPRPPKPARTDSLKTSKSQPTISPPRKLDRVIESAQSIEDLIQPKPSTSTPKPTISRKFASNGSILTPTGHTKYHVLPNSLNRADVIISRLEGWQLFLKSVSGWLEETAKINAASSRGYSQKAYGFVSDESSGIATLKRGYSGDESTEHSNQFILTMQAGLHAITMQLAAEQNELSQTIERQYLPEIQKLRKEVKEKIQKLKADPSLSLDELLKIAEVTRSKMTVLSRCCKQIDTGAQVEMDPWLADLGVLGQLKREVEEENRLRLLLLPIQKDAHDFEKRVIEIVRPAIDYCYQRLSPQVYDGIHKEAITPFQLLLDQISPLSDWDRFVELNKRDLVEENNPQKDYLKINYPNKFHINVSTLMKGNLEKKLSSRKFAEKYCVLTKGGYLHEFSSEDSFVAEKTTHIPSTTIIPSIDISTLTKEQTILNDLQLESTELTFEICKPSTNLLQKDKVSFYRAPSKDSLINWVRVLIEISTGIQLPVVNTIQQNTSDNLDSISSISRSSSKNKRKPSIAPTIATNVTSGSEGPKANTESDTVSHPLKESRSYESFDEPTAMGTKKAEAVSSKSAIAYPIHDFAKLKKAIEEIPVLTGPFNVTEDNSSVLEDNESGVIDDYFYSSDYVEDKEVLSKN